MTSCKSRWPVGRVVHIYNPGPVSRVNNWATTDATYHRYHLWFASDLKKTTFILIARCFVASTHVILALIAPLLPPPPLWEYVYAYINPLLLSQ